jgi:hypothetical protein
MATEQKTEQQGDGAVATADQNTPPSRETYTRLRAPYAIVSGSLSAIAIARPGGSPRPDSRQVVPAS